jgi:hypothetical protein
MNIAQGPHELLEKLLKHCVHNPSNDLRSAAKHISVNMDPGLHQRLKLFCVRQNTNVSSVIGPLVAAYLAEHDA